MRRQMQMQRRHLPPIRRAPAGAQFRAPNTVAGWEAASRKARVPYGAVKSRELVKVEYVNAPPRGYRYVHAGSDIVLIAVASGLIASVLHVGWVAEFLSKHPQVAWVKYAGLPDHPEHELAVRYTGGKPAAILSFGIQGGQAAGARFIDALKLVVRLVNIGDAKSLACHPATTTHRQLNPDEMKKAGVSPEMVRLSIGIEHIDDLIVDLEQALERV